MINMQKNPHIDRAIEFIAKFATSLSSLNKTVINSQESEQRSQNISKDAHKENGSEIGSQGDKTAVNETISNQSKYEESTLMDYEDEESLFVTSFIEYLIEVFVIYF